MTRFGIIAFLSFLLATLPTRAESDLRCETIERIPSMGTVFELQYVGSCDKENKEALVLAVMKRLDSIETSMSLYQKDSEIMRLNRGEEIVPTRDFRQVLELSLEHGKKTDGAFDITIWPVLNAIQKTIQETGRPPSAKSLQLLKSRVDFRNVDLSAERVAFKLPGTQISTDGVAKGYAVDEVASLLRESGFFSYLINFSGNMRILGAHLSGRPWNIAILNPKDRSTFPTELANGESIASSGVDYAYYTTNKRWHHLIDPKTLQPAHRVIGATVMGPSAAVCDILSTATFIMGPKRTRRVLAKSYPSYRYWMVDVNNHVYTNFKPAQKGKVSL